MISRFIYTLWLCLLASSPLFAQEPENTQPWWQQENPPLFDAQRWESAIQAFEAEDETSPPLEKAVVGIGSSSMLYWHGSIKKDLSPLTVIPRGFGGSTMEDALYYLDRIVLPYKPRAVLLYEGDNDIGVFKVSPQQVLETFQALVEKIHSALPDTRIYVISIKPSISRWNFWPLMTEANRLLKDNCASNALLTYIDVASPMLNENGEPRQDIFQEDMLHLNEKGYEIWTRAVSEVVVPREEQYEAKRL